MKSINTQAIITGVRSRQDRSLGLSISTPELSVQEKALFMELQSLNVDLHITPREQQVPEYTIEKQIGQKSQAQRIRGVLFLLFQQDSEDTDTFEEFYRIKTEKYIEFLKGKLDD